MIFHSRLVALSISAALLAPICALLSEAQCDARGGRGGGIKRGGSGLKRGRNFGGGRGLSRRGGRGGRYGNQDLNGDGVVDQLDKKQARGLTSSMAGGGGGSVGGPHLSGAGGNNSVGGQNGNGVTVYHPSPAGGSGH